MSENIMDRDRKLFPIFIDSLAVKRYSSVHYLKFPYPKAWGLRSLLNISVPFQRYAFSWTVIYTFWYHPMENTYGHALGFVHTYIVMIQGSLIFQKIHLNKYWRSVKKFHSHQKELFKSFILMLDNITT